MEPLHPTDVYYEGLILWVMVAMLLSLIVGISYGYWDKFFAVAVDYWPIWKWGG